MQHFNFAIKFKQNFEAESMRNFYFNKQMQISHSGVI
jgi:hypothetical protein